MFYNKALLICGSTVFAAVATGAAALPVEAPAVRPVVIVAERPDQVTRRVSYADLNLASVPGEAMLNRRVGGAVRSLCSEATGQQSYTSRESGACQISAWGQAHPQVEKAVLRARQIASTGNSPITAAAITIVIPH